MDLNAVASAVEKLGLPLAMLAVAVVALWRMGAYIVKLMEAHRLEREQVQAAQIAALGQLGREVADTGAVVREMKDATARSLDRIEMRVQAAASRGFALVVVLVLLALAVCAGCAAVATARAGGQAESSVQEGTQAGSEAQAGSGARVVARRGPRHFGAKFTLPGDAGTLELGVDDEGDELTAEAAAAADAGAASAADAGAASAADAGAAAGARTPPTLPPWLSAVALGVAVLVFCVVALVRKVKAAVP